jgi:hypothetical protein
MFAFPPHFSSRFISVSDGWGGGYGGGGGNVNDSWGGGGGTAGGMDPAAMYQMYQQVIFFFVSYDGGWEDALWQIFAVEEENLYCQ